MLIGISGKIGSGKDTLAGMIKAEDPSYELKSFAYKLKQIVALLAGVPIEDTMTQEGKNIFIPEFNKTVGEMLQVIGTKSLRAGFDDNVWIKTLFADYRSNTSSAAPGSPDYPYPNWVITDVRFKNEARYIKSMGGILVRLDGDPAGIRAASTRDMTHPSEIDLDDFEDFDITYYNMGSLNVLREVAQQILCHKVSSTR
jgi:hypothetical protein